MKLYSIVSICVFVLVALVVVISSGVSRNNRRATRRGIEANKNAWDSWKIKNSIQQAVQGAQKTAEKERDAEQKQTKTSRLGKYFDHMPNVEISDLEETDSTTSTLTKLDAHWEEFKQIFSRQYESTEEEASRRSIWESNAKEIVQHNTLQENGQSSSRVQINDLADMTSEEIKTQKLGYIRKSVMKEKNPDKVIEPLENPHEAVRLSSDIDLPSEIDWRDSGCVTAVKNQGSCGSCYTFSATASLEALDCLWNLKESDSSAVGTVMSEQELVDCSYAEGNEGCGGGYMGYCFTYVAVNDGLDTESCYPYTGTPSTTCEADSSSECDATTDSGYYSLTALAEDELQYYTALIGPISIAVAADNIPFLFYESGVIDDTRCSNSYSDLDHGVAVVGFGTSNGDDYWLVRNSWGPDWGLDGHLKIGRNMNNMCGISWEPSFPAVDGLTSFFEGSKKR